MIDEKKLMQYLKSEANMDRSRAYGEHECDLIEGTIRMCIDVVKAQPKVGEWIPVSEMLPEEGLYLVMCEDVGIQVKYYHSDGTWMSMFDVIAWMPLPEPYKEEE